MSYGRIPNTSLVVMALTQIAVETFVESGRLGGGHLKVYYHRYLYS